MGWVGKPQSCLFEKVTPRVGKKKKEQSEHPLFFSFFFHPGGILFSSHPPRFRVCASARGQKSSQYLIKGVFVFVLPGPGEWRCACVNFLVLHNAAWLGDFLFSPLFPFLLSACVGFLEALWRMNGMAICKVALSASPPPFVFFFFLNIRRRPPFPSPA